MRVLGFQAILRRHENSATRFIVGPPLEAIVRGCHVTVTVFAKCRFRNDADVPFQAECHTYQAGPLVRVVLVDPIANIQVIAVGKRTGQPRRAVNDLIDIEVICTHVG